MELNKSEVILYKKILCETMKAFIAFCKENNLRYFACGGTCLGAIRHKGIIPWDDDIDVLMPREDYNRFLNLKREKTYMKYEIFSPGSSGYYLPFAKFVYTGMTLVEVKEYPLVLGTFIDVFPLDEVGDLDIAQKLSNHKKKVFSDYSLTIKKYYISEFIDMFLKLRIKCFLKDLWYSLFGSFLRKKYLRRFYDSEIDIQKQHGDKCMYYGGFYDVKKEVCQQEWFGAGVEVPFEDFSIRVPQNYDAYLTNMFGDYMTPPPVEKQVTHHNLYFIDLNKRWDIKEVMQLKLGKQKLKEYKYE